MADSIISNPNMNKTSSSATVDSNYGTSNLTIYKVGNIVQLIGDITITTDVPRYTNVINIPLGYIGYAQSIYAKKSDSNIFYWLFGYNAFSPQTEVLQTGKYYFNETWIIN